jgi:dCMP deaminase
VIDTRSALQVLKDEASRERQEKWDHRFLNLAREVASWSKDPSTKVGAVVVRPDLTIATMGFNGFPRGFPDDPEDYADRVRKYRFVVHAEANALVSASESLKGCTLYTYPLPPCVDCCKLAIQAGITRFVSVRPSVEHLERWRDSFDATDIMLMKTRLYAIWYDEMRSVV